MNRAPHHGQLMRRLLAIFVVSQLLISSLWASVHMAADPHAAFESPHLHLSLDLHTDHAELPGAEGELEHEPENHIHMCFLALSGQPGWHCQSGQGEKTPFFSRIVNTVLIPPVPPPNP